MAFVGITAALTSEISERIARMRDAEIKASVPSEGDKTIQYEGNQHWLDPLFWDDRLELKTVIPDSWKAKNDYAYLQVRVQDNPEAMLVEAEFKVRAQHKMEFCPSHYSYTPHIKVNYATTAEVPIAIRQLMEEQKQITEIRSKWRAIREKVCGFVEQCKSLNEALKLWPDLRMYIPDSYLERVEHKAQRKAAEKSSAMEALANLNLEEIQAAAVVARLSGAKL